MEIGAGYPLGFATEIAAEDAKNAEDTDFYPSAFSASSAVTSPGISIRALNHGEGVPSQRAAFSRIFSGQSWR